MELGCVELCELEIFDIPRLFLGPFISLDPEKQPEIFQIFFSHDYDKLDHEIDWMQHRWILKFVKK